MNQLARLVGRRDEFALLREHLSGVGDARLAIVSGEAGIGKTWLVAEASAAADGVVLSARSLPWSSPMSLQPFTDLLRAAYETDKSWVNEGVDRCPPYVRSSIVNLLPELSEARDVGVAAGPDEYARPRLFAAVRAFWIAFTSVRPCALVIDDAHWADPTTVDLVEYLLAQSGGHLPPLVLTYRREAPGTAAGIVDRFEHLDRAPGVARVRLFGLSRSETATLIADVTGTEPSIETVNAIFARSEGHPLFAAQLATASPGHLPRALVDLFDHALAALDDHATRVAQVLAVAMRPMEQSWLCEVDGLKARDVENAVRQLEQHRLLRPTLDSRVDLRHALLMELIRSRMPDGRRREISGNLARAMAAGPVGEALSASPVELAVLWRDAEHREEELRWRARAAHEAKERHAWTATAEHWRRAIELLATSPDAVAGLEHLTGRTMAEVYSEASEAVHLSGDSDGASDLALLALEHTERDDPMRMAEALRRAGPLVGYRDPARGRKMVDAAIELYQQLPAGCGPSARAPPASLPTQGPRPSRRRRSRHRPRARRGPPARLPGSASSLARRPRLVGHGGRQPGQRLSRTSGPRGPSTSLHRTSGVTSFSRSLTPTSC